ncbi:Phosphoglycolate phosphatase [Arsenophonus endosymbiont of Bemisia tabaci Q2]|nr:Phosphoglycolate phosphatase [Arsenophonus endosymbiont of Bemisia tabaci Q2]
MRHRYFVRTQYGVIKIKSLSYKDQLLFVGDSHNDILAAKAADCPCVGLTYGYNYGESIALSKPDYVLDNCADLLPALGLPPLTTMGS